MSLLNLTPTRSVTLSLTGANGSVSIGAGTAALSVLLAPMLRGPAGPAVPPGGADRQVQFNDGGAFGGSASFTWDKATNTLKLGPKVCIGNAGVNDTAYLLRNVSGYGIIGGFGFEAGGNTFVCDATSNGIPGGPAISFRLNDNLAGIRLRSGSSFTWAPSSTDPTGVPDLLLSRDAAGVLAQRNGTNTQTFRLYGSYTDSSNYQRLALNTSATQVELAAESAGTGAANIDVVLTPKGAGRVKTNNALSVNAIGKAAPGLIVQVDDQQNVFQYLKGNGTNLVRAIWDGSNFHHYVNGTIYYNIGSGGLHFDGNGSANVGIGIRGNAYIALNSLTTSAPGNANLWAGPNAYATAGNQLTSISPIAFSTWAWNGANGWSISSRGSLKQVQQSAADGDARLAILNTSGAEVISFDYLTKVTTMTTAKTPGVTVAALLAAATAGAGARAFVTDATLAAAGNFGAAVVGGGANKVPVWCDGAAWFIG
ncbi:hypothetical protein [Aquabacterium sp.]|uniref:hypothetical protein n=1 Tax=Aquabacterium sp. TaxID=1872578 RepID=UPI0025C2A485|nr:hypothetical protein [Aquabacterium sp.]